MAGKLIVIEGLDGSGKSTQINLLAKRLDSTGYAYMQIKLPNYKDSSSTLVKMYLAGEFGKNADDVNPYAASCFYAVDRYASFKKYWQEQYEKGSIIIADRYTTSNAVHQTAKLPESKWDDYLKWLFEFEYEYMQIPRPDVVIYLDVDVEHSQRLMDTRYNNNQKDKDIHERDIQYLRRCRQGALYAAKRYSWNVIECMQNGKVDTVKSISAKIWEIVKQYL